MLVKQFCNTLEDAETQCKPSPKENDRVFAHRAVSNLSPFSTLHTYHRTPGHALAGCVPGSLQGGQGDSGGRNVCRNIWEARVPGGMGWQEAGGQGLNAKQVNQLGFSLTLLHCGAGHRPNLWASPFVKWADTRIPISKGCCRD